MRRSRRLGLSALLATLALLTAGCDPLDLPAASTWTPRPAPTVWPSVDDLTHYLPADGDLPGTGLTRVGPPVYEPRSALLRVCDLTQPWDALVKRGATLTWQAGGQEIRQVITTYGRISGAEVVKAIMNALGSCGTVIYEGGRFHDTAGVGMNAADAAEAHEIFCTAADPGPEPHRCFALLAAHDRLTQLAFSGVDKDFRDQLDLISNVIGTFAVAVART